MKVRARLTPHYLQLVQDACLRSFWRRAALTKFLRSCGIPDRYLASWDSDETKRDLLDRLFDDLPRTDSGRVLILKMSGALMEQRSFPDLLNWEDSETKIKQAYDALDRLRSHHRRQEGEIAAESDREEAQKRFREHQSNVAQAQVSLSRLSEGLNELGQRLGTQAAGYDFQDWFYDLADFSEVQNKRPYVAKGRQIDGSITVSGTTYLIELKFTTNPADGPAIDSLFKKVTSKADNTMGIMVSISGYSSVALTEASGPRTPLLLLDHGHLYLILGGVMSLAEVVERVRRHASQTGEAYLASGDFGK